MVDPLSALIASAVLGIPLALLAWAIDVHDRCRYEVCPWCGARNSVLQWPAQLGGGAVGYPCLCYSCGSEWTLWANSDDGDPVVRARQEAERQAEK